MSITRRLFLRNSAAAGAVAATVVVPVAVSAHTEDERYARLLIYDNHAHRLVRPGDVVIYNTHDQELEDCATYVTMTDKMQRLFVCRARKVRGYWWAERFDGRDWYGPMDEAFFRQRIRGRAVAMMSRLDGRAQS
ncbi:hypothetical protein ASD64_19980 [Mesorhizobium sp. Root157]|uniref:twin-arginine translocation signal domain-containing protein n=1 Tax=Mesorhizobium sp. Root157 TaxID=1736477 RepID=UPI000701C09F|nr:twin-arginine translocation signal domain-containing protein [Mesorhizobium sp. Root157]KQZ87357.1 hypothetical protein ASD64_19980 [Mesorhizobium sp. Root157]